jgi:hypothetical protein
MLRRMGELGMQILERVGEEAKEAPKSLDEPMARRPDPVLAFNRIARCLRDTMAMEARTGAGKLPAAPREESESAADPRRPAIKKFILDLIDDSPHPKSVKAGLRNQLDPLITEHLEDDLEQDHPPAAIVLEICKEIGLACSTSDMPDELLVRLHRSSTQAEKDAVADEVYRRIHGHDPP